LITPFGCYTFFLFLDFLNAIISDALSIPAASEDESEMQGEEYEAEVSIGTEIPEQEQVDEYQSQDVLLDTNQQTQEDPSTSTVRFNLRDESGEPQLLIFPFDEVHF